MRSSIGICSAVNPIESASDHHIGHRASGDTYTVLVVVVLVLVILAMNFLSIYIRALVSGARVTFTELIALRLRGVPGWQQRGTKICRTWAFADFKAAMAFVNRVAALADESGLKERVAARLGRFPVSSHVPASSLGPAAVARSSLCWIHSRESRLRSSPIFAIGPASKATACSRFPSPASDIT